MATYPVKYMHSDMRGAPTLSGSAGTLIGVLDACLVDGFGLTSVTALSVSSGVATATVGSGNSFEEGAIVLIAGATPGTLNGEQRVTGSTSTTFTFATTATDGSASGTITAKYAPVGSWEKAYSGTNKAVYRSTDVAGSGCYLRIDDTGTTTCRVRGYESMSDVDTGVAPFPTDSQISGGGYWHKSNAADSTSIKYVLAADSRAFRIAICPASRQGAAYRSSVVRGFGDEKKLAAEGDAYCCTISANNTATINSNAAYGAYSAGGSGSSSVYFVRPFSGLGGSVSADSLPYVGNVGDVSGAADALGAFPSAVDGELKLSRRFLTLNTSNKTPRAEVVGLVHLPQSDVSASVNFLDTLAGAGDLAGHTLLAVNVTINNYPTDTTFGVALLDITGPWR